MEIVQGIKLTKYLGQMRKLTFFDHKNARQFLISGQNPFILGKIPGILEGVYILP
jgi:hypothetical protein